MRERKPLNFLKFIDHLAWGQMANIKQELAVVRHMLLYTGEHCLLILAGKQKLNTPPRAKVKA
jgi:hypothetical protein